MRITSEQQLREIYKQPKGRAVTKQLDHLDQHALSFFKFITILHSSDLWARQLS